MDQQTLLQRAEYERINLMIRLTHLKQRIQEQEEDNEKIKVRIALMRENGCRDRTLLYGPATQPIKEKRLKDNGNVQNYKREIDGLAGELEKKENEIRDLNAGLGAEQRIEKETRLRKLRLDARSAKESLAFLMGKQTPRLRAEPDFHQELTE